MIVRTRGRPRRGIVLVEAAVVYPVFLMVLLGCGVAGLGLFRHHEVSYLARESARWAAMQDAPPAASEILEAVVRPKAVGIDLGSVSITPSYAGDMTTVTISYGWTPEAFFGPVAIRSTAVVWSPYR